MKDKGTSDCIDTGMGDGITRDVIDGLIEREGI